MAKERPILFSTPMVQAILQGRKTQTRRIVKPQPTVNNGTWRLETKALTQSVNIPPDQWHKLPFGLISPYGEIGDALWVRETWAPAFGDYAYKADYSDFTLSKPQNKGLWKPSIHMPKAAARIWLRITDVRVERLQDISDADAIAEGIELVDQVGQQVYKRYDGYNTVTSQPAVSYWSLWEAIHGEESWQENPWVWVLSFEVVSTTGRKEANP
jgi:hypothetical protein